jgi:hypothetical protein
MSSIFFGRGSRLSNPVVEVGILIWVVVRKGRERGRGISVDRLAVKPPKARRLGASSYQEPDRHRDKPEMKMPTPNGRWHGHETSSNGMQL